MASRSRRDEGGVECGSEKGERVSVIMPAHNEEERIGRALESLFQESHRPLELSVYDDASSDCTLAVVRRLKERLEATGIDLRLSCSKCHFQSGTSPCLCSPCLPSEATPAGVAAAKNRAVHQSTGSVLCFVDADDWIENERIAGQLHVLRREPNAIVGSLFRRDPPGSTERYARWANSLTDTQLITNRFKECTVLQPTWMVARRMFDAVGGYREDRLCEDLDFFYRQFDAFVARHGYASGAAYDRLLLTAPTPPLQARSRHPVDHASPTSPPQPEDELPCTAATVDKDKNEDGGSSAPDTKRSKCALDMCVPRPYAFLRRVTTVYTYRKTSASHRVSRALIREVRAAALQRQVLRHPPWSSGFSIWGAGKNGRQFYKLLDPTIQANVKCFVDIDPKKVGSKYNDHGPDRKALVRSIDIRPLTDLAPPFITCVAMDRGDDFERMLTQKGFTEGIDYYLFG